MTKLEGNKFVNGLLIGVAETASGIFAGVLSRYTSSKTTFRLLGVLGIVFNSLNNFLASSGGFVAYSTVFVGRLGVAGLFSTLFTLIADTVPTA